jgi:hypothetical protein
LPYWGAYSWFPRRMSTKTRFFEHRQIS